MRLRAGRCYATLLYSTLLYSSIRIRQSFLKRAPRRPIITAHSTRVISVRIWRPLVVAKPVPDCQTAGLGQRSRRRAANSQLLDVRGVWARFGASATRFRFRREFFVFDSTRGSVSLVARRSPLAFVVRSSRRADDCIGYLRLVSWPIRFDLGSSFAFRLARRVFDARFSS